MSIPSRSAGPNESARARVEGAILAGGRSRRMGRDKSALRLAGVPMIERVARAIRPLATRVRAIGGDPATAAKLGLEHQPDLLPGLGPLAGLHAALTTTECSRLLVVASDLPLVSTPFLRGLLARLASDLDAVVPVALAGEPTPVCGVYRNSARVREAVERRISARRLSATGLLEDLRVRLVRGEELEALDPEGWCLFNVNTPQDFARATTLLPGGE